MEIRHIAVVGAGQMGAGIAQVAAQAGLEVTLVDVNQGAAENAKAKIAAQLEKQVAKGKLAVADKDAILARLKPAATVQEAAGAQFAVEAIVENEAVKRELFQALDRTLGPEAILATNTSSIPITRLAAATKRPTQVIGMHFMNPVPVMKLVELIRGAQTSDETYATVNALAAKLGKTTVVSRDSSRCSTRPASPCTRGSGARRTSTRR
jgi:3-hydroxybutyryl-CoA dehydrogenase